MQCLELAVAALLTVACVGAVCGAGEPERNRAVSRNVRLRGALTNCRIRFELDKRGHVAFLGGSITEMNGYRPMVMDILRRRFPHAEFAFTNAGIASTCSTTGAFRLEADVLSKGPVDLLFIEFAVNDDQDAAHTRTECIRGMEGIVRHTRRHNPRADIVITYFVNPGMLKLLQEGKTPLPMAAHEAVARRYQCSTIHLAKEVAERIAAGTLTWEQFGGTHPAPHGNAICAKMIDQLMDRAWGEPLGAAAMPALHAMPEPLDPLSYVRGRFLPLKDAEVKDGWVLGVPERKSLKGNCRRRFAEATMLSATEPGAELTLAFEGTALGAYILAGPDAGIVEASIGGGPFQAFDLYHRFSRGLHYPRTVVFAADLEPGQHTLTLRMTGRRNAASSGHAMRILRFVAN